MDRTYLNKKLADAVDLFLMTQFNECFCICSEVIDTAKCSAEQDRTQEVIEAATALGIQALAETDKWQQVLDFISSTYESIELTPPRIIQVCILLHAHVQEYSLCHKIVQAWLKNPHNLNHSQCSKVIRIYAQHILCPTGAYDTLQEIINNGSLLSNTDRDILLQLPQSGRFEAGKYENSTRASWLLSSDENKQSIINCDLSEAAKLNRCCNLNPYVKDESKHYAKSKSLVSKGKVMMIAFCKFTFLNIKTFFETQKSLRLILFGILALWALVQTQNADPVSSLSRFVILWRGFIEKIKQIYSPH